MTRPRETMRPIVLGGAAPPEVVLPLVRELPARLAEIDSVDELQALHRTDDRPTAAQHYERRINEITAAKKAEGE